MKAKLVLDVVDLWPESFVTLGLISRNNPLLWIAYLAERWIYKKADIIISSLPLANFSEELRNSILEIVHESLNEKGSFIQFQYSLNAFKNLKKLFPVVKLNFTALNFPPAFVYTCSKR